MILRPEMQHARLLIPPRFPTLKISSHIIIPHPHTPDRARVNALPKDRLWLMDIAREAGDRYYSPATGRCLIARDTYWYAIALSFDEQDERRQFGTRLLATLEPEDATHTPATLLAILQRLPGMIAPPSPRGWSNRSITDWLRRPRVISTMETSIILWQPMPR